jgi:membrane-associated phospholipid phosphatase
VRSSTSAAAGVRALNVFVLDRVSHQLNTFPSGHVAVTFVAAVGVCSVSPAAGLAVGALVAAIAAGALAGRYHYVIDVLLAFVIGAVALVLADKSH